MTLQNVQECIPVGCIPPTAVAILGGLHETPPQEQTPGSRHPPAARHAGLPPAMHAGIAPPGDLLQGMLGYHLQCMLG